MSENPWIIEAEYDGPRKDLTFPAPHFGKMPSRKNSLSNLRINTYPKADLPSRYNSDEEEPSPSPDSETASACEEEEEGKEVEAGEEDEEEEELKHKSALKPLEDDNDIVIYEDYSAEVAVAVPIMIMGPPKLIDITIFAPIQRRKRAINHPTLQRSAMKNAVMVASRSPDISDEGRSPALPAPTRSAPLIPSNESAMPTKASTPITTDGLPKRQDSLPDLARIAPDSWLPEESTDVLLESVEEQDDLYFPALDVLPSPTYNDYDAYSLDHPSLSLRHSHSYKATPKSSGFSSPLLKKHSGSIARARKHSNPPSVMTNGGWKGLTRSLSITKRQELSCPQAKKPKMIARGATERARTPSIPPFSYQETLGNQVTASAARSTTALSTKS